MNNDEIQLKKSVNSFFVRNTSNSIFFKTNHLNDYNFSNDNSFTETENDSFSIKEILELKDKLFESEYNKFSFTFSTTVEFKEKKTFIQQTLLINDYKLYIIDNIKNKTKCQKKPIKLYTEESILNKILNSESLSCENQSTLYNISKPSLSINFNLISCKLISDEKKKIITLITLGKKLKHFYIRILNSEVFKIYCLILNRIILNSLGYKSNLMGFSLRYKNFYKYNAISNEEFESKAKTGDLLLFRKNDCSGCFQRFITRDKYDHIALIIKKNKNIQIYDANYNNKCNTTFWEVFKHNNFNLCYDKIVYRRLRIEENDKNKLQEIQVNIEKEIDEFINQTEKKDYFISYCSLICGNKLKKYEITNNWKESKGYSCSSLITAAYYKLGILKKEKSIHSYLPGYYSQNNNINFNKGFSLGNEEIIEFSN